MNDQIEIENDEIENDETFVDGECSYHGPVSGSLDPAGDPPESCPQCSYEEAIDLAIDAARGK